MATGSSSVPLLHLLSHSWVHTLPQTAGNGFSLRMRLYASLSLPVAIRAMYPGTFMPAGHAFWQGDMNISAHTPALQYLYFMCSSNSSLKLFIMLSTGFGAVWPRPHMAASFIIAPSSSSFSMSPSSPLPWVILSRISSMRFVPSLHGTHLPQDSSCMNSMKYLAISTMQVSSSIVMRPPEPIIAPSLVSDS